MPGEKTSFIRDGMLVTHIDGVLSSEVPVSDTGVERRYHPNGALADEIPRKHGQTHGIVRGWHDNGVLATEREDVFGQTFGLSRHWGREGSLEIEMNYVLPEAVHGCNFYHEGRRRCAYLWNGKPLSKAKWIKRVLATGMSQVELEERLAR